jgi:hypothetical protein
MEGGALDACADLALRRGAFASLDRRSSAPTDDGNARFERKKHGPFTAELDGFNVQAAVRIEADDDEGRERLVRYCARPCFALDRLSLLPDGRVAYRVLPRQVRRARRHAPRDDAGDSHPTRRRNEANVWARGTPAPRLDELNLEARTVQR